MVYTVYAEYFIGVFIMRVVLAAEDKYRLNIFSSRLCKEDCDVLFATTDEAELLKAIEICKVDIVVLGEFSNGIDDIIEKLKAAKKEIFIVALLSGERELSEKIPHKADYIMYEPIDMKILYKKMRMLISAELNEATRLEEAISYTGFVLQRLGITPVLKGYNYILLAIKLAFEDEENIKRVTKCLYPRIARLEKTTLNCVEHSIRNAIDSSYKKRVEYSAYSYLGFADTIEYKKPSNSVFLNVLFRYISNRYKSLVSEEE